MKKLFTLFIITLALKASSVSPQELISNINTIFSNKIYNSIDPFSFSFKENKNNLSSQKIKEDLKKILPSYLETKPLFTRPLLTHFKEQNKTLVGVSIFIKLSFSYANYLQHHNQEKLALQIIEQNLINLQDLMTNAPNMLDYLIALAIYSKIFDNYIPSSYKIVTLFQKYPPPSASLYFQKLEAEKKELFKRLDSLSHINQDIIDTSQKEAYEKLMKKIKASAKSHLEKYFSQMRLAASSKKEQIKFKNYLKKENEELFTTSTQIKMALHSAFAKLFYFFVGYNYEFDYIAKYIGKMLALISLPRLEHFYQEHLKMLQKYHNFLEKAK